MSTKICPSCQTEVPALANLCKHCFHDFHLPVVKRSSPLWTILFLAVGTAIVTAMAYGYIQSQQHTQNISIDPETKSIVFTTTWSDHTEANRVFYKDIDRIEYVKNAHPRPFEIAIVTTDGDRYIYQQSADPLAYPAKQLGDTIGHRVETIDTSGRDDRGKKKKQPQH